MIAKFNTKLINDYLYNIFKDIISKLIYLIVCILLELEFKTFNYCNNF
jgi:hypothetical protein